MYESYFIGTVLRITVEFYDNTVDPPVLADPTAVTMQFQTPDEEEEDAVTPTKDSTGVYHYDYTITQAGWHIVKATGSGAIVGVQEKRFHAKATEI